MREDLDERILDALLPALDRDGTLNSPHLAAEFPGDEDVLERFEQAARAYAELFTNRSRDALGPMLAQGERLGDFEILSLVGRGAAGAVYRAKQLSLGGRIVALKVSRAGEDRPERSERSRREALALAELHHPSLAEVHGFGVERGLAYLAMRLIEGPTLREVIRGLRDGAFALERPLLRRTEVRWIAEIAEALAVVHAAGLVHRDVKPANVIVERGRAGRDELSSARAVLIDFGLARSPELVEAREGGASATAAYAAPEQILGRELGPPADVFALGVTLHDLLCLREPRERGPAQLGLSSPPDLDRDLAAVLARATDPSERWRYRDARELAIDLRAWLAGEPVSARRPTLLERARHWYRSRRARIARTGAVGMLLFLLLACGWTFGEWAGDRRAVARARTAFDEGDPLVLGASFASIARPWRAALIGNPVTRAIEDLRAGSTAGDLYRHLLANDREGALFLAVTRLRERGFAAEPFAAHHLEAELRRSVAECAGGVASSESALPIYLTMRLMNERPAVGAGELADCERLRLALLEAWRTDGLSRETRLSIASALAGCASPEVMESLIDWALASPLGSEERWLGSYAAERAVRTLHRGGNTPEIAYERLWSKIASSVSAAFEAWPRDGKEVDAWAFPELPLIELACALGYAELEAEGATRLSEIVPGRWLDAQIRGSHLLRAQALVLGAAAPSAVPKLLRTESCATRERAWLAGWACGTAEEPELAREVRERCSTAGTAAGFEEGLSRGLGRRRGVDPDLEVDTDSMLSSSPTRHAWVELETLRSEPPVEGVLAAWRFNAVSPELSGLSLGVRLSGASRWLEEEGDRCLRGVPFGESAVELTFKAPSKQLEEGVALELFHLAAARRYFPFRGKVYLEVSLDGEVLDSLAVTHQRYRVDTVVLRTDRLTPGEHVIRLRLAPFSTTTYRLVHAVLRPAQEIDRPLDPMKR